MDSRKSTSSRKTAETEIEVILDLDGAGKVIAETGVGFFDHMLTLLGRHALFDLEVSASGDLDVDAHHTVEDVGIVLGETFAAAIGDKRGITRYGAMLLPMDEALVRVVLDVSGRPCLDYRAEIKTAKVGEFDTCLVREFLRGFTLHAGITLHVELLAGVDPHHCLEAIFKGLGRALRQAITIDPREKQIPSSKGVL